MSLTNPKNVITEERLAEFYQGILPYLGGMPDVLANKFSKSDLYSTDEKIIGQWINGKPLYQKTIQDTIPTSNDGWISISHNIANIDSCVDAKIGIIDTTSGSYSIIGGVYGSSSNNKFFGQFGKSSIAAYIIPNSTYKGMTLQATVQYTKITDSPVSVGNDTDYSTIEKIVGTWIDGKPIYQKTIEFNATGQSITTTYLNLEMATLSNIENVINPISGYAEWGDTIQPIPLSVDITGSIWADYNFNYSENKLYFRAKRSSGTTALGKIYATLQYTKTTD